MAFRGVLFVIGGTAAYVELISFFTFGRSAFFPYSITRGWDTEAIRNQGVYWRDFVTGGRRE